MQILRSHSGPTELETVHEGPATWSNREFCYSSLKTDELGSMCRTPVLELFHGGMEGSWDIDTPTPIGHY